MLFRSLIAAALPGMSAQAIAAAMGRSRREVKLRLARLRAAGVIPPYQRPMKMPPQEVILCADPAPMRRRLSVALPPGSDVPLCQVRGCERTRYSVGMCKMHYLRSYKVGHPAGTYIRQPAPDDGSVVVDTSRTVCMVVGCRCIPRVRGVCRPHYDYLIVRGRTGELPPGRNKR